MGNCCFMCRYGSMDNDFWRHGWTMAYRDDAEEITMQPLNVDQLQLGEVWGAEDASIHWKGGFFAYGGAGSEESATIYFAVEPGKRLGRHTDTTEETQLILSGNGELRLDSGAYAMKA